MLHQNNISTSTYMIFRQRKKGPGFSQSIPQTKCCKATVIFGQQNQKIEIRRQKGVQDCPIQVQDLVPGLVELHEVCVGPPLVRRALKQRTKSYCHLILFLHFTILIPRENLQVNVYVIFHSIKCQMGRNVGSSQARIFKPVKLNCASFLLDRRSLPVNEAAHTEAAQPRAGFSNKT